MRVLLLATTAIICANLSGQGLTQSAEGKSTIPVRGTTVGIDLAKTELSFGINNFNRQVTDSGKFKPFFGFDIKVKNEEGIGKLFSAGDLVPAGSANFQYGLSRSNINKKMQSRSKDSSNKEAARFQKELEENGEKFKSEMPALIESKCNSIQDTTARKLTKEEIYKAFKAADSLPLFYAYIKEGPNDSPEVLQVKRVIVSAAKAKDKQLNLLLGKHQEKMKGFKTRYDDIMYKRFTIFGFGGINALDFKRFIKYDSANLANSFEDVNERGGKIGIGLNYQIGNFWLGATYSYVSTNNFSRLKKNEYTLRRTTTVAPQSLIEDSKVTAYSGNYSSIEINELNFDAIYYLKLDSNAKNNILINPYFRGNLFSRDTALLPNKINIGTGFYFFQKGSKFLGGFYVELPDINDNEEKKKPADERNIRPAIRKLTFGIIAKFNLSTFFGW